MRWDISATDYEGVQGVMKFLQDILKVEVNAEENVTTTQNAFLLNGGEIQIHIHLWAQIIVKALFLVLLRVPLQPESRIEVLCMSKVT